MSEIEVDLSLTRGIRFQRYEEHGINPWDVKPSGRSQYPFPRSHDGPLWSRTRSHFTNTCYWWASWSLPFPADFERVHQLGGTWWKGVKSRGQWAAMEMSAWDMIIMLLFWLQNCMPIMFGMIKYCLIIIFLPEWVSDEIVVYFNNILIMTMSRTIIMTTIMGMQSKLLDHFEARSPSFPSVGKE